MNSKELGTKRMNGGVLKPNQTHNQWMNTNGLVHQLHTGNVAGGGPRTNAFLNHHGHSAYHRANRWRSSNYNLNNKHNGNKINISSSSSSSNGYPKPSKGTVNGERRQKNTRNFNSYYQHQFDPSTWLKDPEQHKILTQSLQDTLHSHGVFEETQGSRKRLEVLNELERLLSDWADNLLNRDHQARAPTEEDVNNDTSHAKSKVRLISFGSYRLGVHSPSADLDLLALCPPHVLRNDFFTSFVECLLNDDRVTSVHPVPTAYTPVIKFNWSDIPIDMLFVRLADGSKLLDDSCVDTFGTSTNTTSVSNAGSIPLTDTLSNQNANSPRNEFQIDDTMLQGLDEASVRSLNGVRVAQYLLDIIPDKKTFRKVLKTVKQWACVHGLYSNVLGFLGGINWAILVAWVCQRNPEASPPVLLKIFFQTFSKWRWPKPVILTQILRNPPPGVAPLTIWDPSCNPRDRSQIMPIVTPCFPSMNSSYNVGQSQLRRLREELHRGDKIMNQIANNNATFDLLLKENDFFKDHVHYLHISIIAANENDHRAWFGLCESRLRILIAGLDSEEYGTQAYPFAKFFTQTIEGNENDSKDEQSAVAGEIQTSFFIGLRFAHGVETVDLKGCSAEYVYIANTWEDRKDGMDLKIQHLLQNDLPAFVFDEATSSAACNDSPENEDIKVDGAGTDPGTENKPSVSLVVATSLNNSDSPDDCLASPMKKTKISRS